MRPLRLKVPHRTVHYVWWAFLHTAVVVFTADLIAACWPSFNTLWKPVAKVGVSGATILATLFEYFHEEEENAEAERPIPPPPVG